MAPTKGEMMKHLKMLGLAVLAAMALASLVGAASASAKEGVLCSTATDSCTSKWAVPTVMDFSLTPGTSAKLESFGITLDTCTTATVKGKLTANPDATGTATGVNEIISWGSAATPCTYPTTTLKLGGLKVEAEDNLGNGWVYADAEIEVTIQNPTAIGGPCIYAVAAGTKLGTLKEGIGSASRFIANATATRKQSATHPCTIGGSTAVWNAEYSLTEPSNTTLWVSHK
jgi:hypothetical protein